LGLKVALSISVSWKSRVPGLNIGDADTAEKLSWTGVITLYILSITTFIVLQSILSHYIGERRRELVEEGSIEEL
jgi:hypothetical protein